VSSPTPLPELLVQRLDPELPLPAYAHPGDAGADLRAAEPCTLAPGGGRGTVRTGLAVAIPEGWAGFVLPRSGLARNHGVTCLNTPGLIDAGYRGELMVVLVNTDPTTPYEVQRGDRIAQLVLQRVESVTFTAVATLPASVRGEGRFGSSGT
jgi:dUTP pyrophosphatase